MVVEQVPAARRAELFFPPVRDEQGAAMSLLLLLPWCGARVVSGWSRNVLLGHFFALMPIFFKVMNFEKIMGREQRYQIDWDAPATDGTSAGG